MNKILELQQKAQSLQEKHQSDIDKKLNSEMQAIFNDTERTLSEKAQSLMTSIDTTQTTIQAKQSESTAQITQQIEQHTRKILAIQTKQLEQFTADQQAKLAQLNSEYRDSESLEDPRYSFEIKYSPDFNSLYSSYFQHCNERNQLREVHANQRAQSADSSHKQRYSIENAGSSRFIHSDLQHQQESQIEQTDEYASTVINDYRRSAEEARRCFEYYSKTEHDNTTARQLQQRTARESYNFDRLSKEANSSIEQYSISRFVSKVLSPLQTALDNHLKHLIDSLDIKSLVSTQIESLIEMQSKAFKEQLSIQQQNTQQQVKQAVEQEVKPIKQQLMSELEAVQKSQQHLQDLIQQLSAKL